jgi:O-antigen/teichoic acid export membrane protein
MFRAGQDGIWGAVRYAKRNMVRATLYSIAAFIALELFAPIVPHVLGHGYDRTVEALRWLALIPLLKSVQFFAADALTGAGFQGTRTLIQVATAVTNIIVNLWIIRAYSWRGAAWSSIGSDLFLSCILWVAIAVIMQKRRTVAGASKQADSTVTFLESGAPATAGSMEP